jgi:hypothetical protein
MTTFQNKTIILGELWINYRGEEGFEDFIEYNDLALPFAFSIAEGLVEPQESMARFIEDAWLMLLTALKVEDLDYTTLQELLEQSYEVGE